MSADLEKSSQETLFDLGVNQEVGYRVPVACEVAGITYRQLDYWARTDFVVPSIQSARGSGSQRLYSFKDLLVLKVVKRLLDAGISLQKIRTAVGNLKELGVEDLSGVTLVSDGNDVYECRSNDEVIELLRGGQGVFGIFIPGVIKDVAGIVSAYEAEVPVIDELAERRRLLRSS